MDDVIKSVPGLAKQYAAELKSGSDPALLEEVNDDNTLAENGAYCSYNEIRDAYMRSRSLLMSDAEQMQIADDLFTEADMASANGF